MRRPTPIKNKMEPIVARIIQVNVGACDISKIAATARSDTPTTIKEMPTFPPDFKAIRERSLPGTF